jgi:hypothetical protein
MSRVRQTSVGISFACPGCGDIHSVPTDRWSWNGSLDKPTITPSISVTGGHYAPHFKPGEDECWCWKDYGFSCYRCHSVVTNGKIAFQADSTHALAGQTIDLPEI